MSQYIGWDIGGAHVKFAQITSEGGLKQALQLPCPLWKGSQTLQAVVSKIMREIDSSALHGITMTGEMADCFANRADGVRAILAIMKALIPQEPYVYLNDGSLCHTHDIHDIDAVASANWHATANYLAKHQARGVVIDLGSTTTDIISFNQQRVLSKGKHDGSRLANHELVYTGMVRTPVMAVAREVKVEGSRMPIVAEQFASMADVYRILGKLPPQADQYPTCDGEAKTYSASVQRLARMFGYDSQHDESLWETVAQLLAEKQQAMVVRACEQVYQQSQFEQSVAIIGAGVGKCLLSDMAKQMKRSYTCFSQVLDIDETAADYAAAVSVAYLLRHEMR